MRVGARHLAAPARRGAALAAAAGRHRARKAEITWVEPTYHAVHTTLTHPAYAGAYVYGRTRDEIRLGPGGALRKRRRRLPRDQWEVLIPDHHPGFTDWDTYLANQEKIGGNIRPQASAPGTGAVREGSALLQGLATCGSCGRKLAVFYRGPAKATQNYYCQGADNIVDGRGSRHMNTGGQAIDAAVAAAFLAALSPPPWTPACRQPASSSRTTTPCWTSTAARQSRRGTTPAGPSGATAPSTRTTGWSPAAWKPNGTPPCSSSPTPRQNSPGGRPPGRRPSLPVSGQRSSPSATTSASSGTPRPPPTGTASSCCGPCWRR